jgi:hypothetical protein
MKLTLSIRLLVVTISLSARFTKSNLRQVLGSTIAYAADT